ncbi:uncharacterized protein LOC110809687 [Carica papaya]|uniref:uncharacterized protein LOC110809687 n=1 Tax=Carica papaya TaxID=3649 RepID=UPI000B8C6EC4|nr:uncharacterized protein LOC110809687 [Carica papaya]XP_021891269.1 uncharacterized protein LOC110809687 [Carica papaya]
MLSDIQLRTRAVALSLYALPSQNRPGGSAVPITKGTNINSNSHYEDQMKSLFSNDDPELLKPLVPDDPTSSQGAKQCSNGICRSFLWRAGQAICIILGAVVVLVILVVLCSVI